VYVSRDEKGNILKYDGLNDYSVWESAFKADMARKGHGCVLNNDGSGPPRNPTDALRRIRRKELNPHSRCIVDDFTRHENGLHQL
jgi:hypothetical protein